jgi:hypothetical protein
MVVPGSVLGLLGSDNLLCGGSERWLLQQSRPSGSRVEAPSGFRAVGLRHLPSDGLRVHSR